MTGGTRRQWLYMIRRRGPGLGAVTHATIRCRRNMVRRFTRRRGAIMTGTATARYFIVINLGRRRPAFG